MYVKNYTHFFQLKVTCVKNYTEAKASVDAQLQILHFTRHITFNRNTYNLKKKKTFVLNPQQFCGRVNFYCTYTCIYYITSIEVIYNCCQLETIIVRFIGGKGRRGDNNINLVQRAPVNTSPKDILITLCFLDTIVQHIHSSSFPHTTPSMHLLF